MDSTIKHALLAMAFGALGAVAVQGAVWLLVPQPVRFAQVDLVGVMETEIHAMAKSNLAGEKVDTAARAKQIQEAVAAIADETGRLIIAKQALVAGRVVDVPDVTDDVLERLH